MTRKSFAKLQRSRLAAKRKSDASGDTWTPRLKSPRVPNRMVPDLFSRRLIWMVADESDINEPPLPDPAAKKVSPSARCAIVATTFCAATNGVVCRRLKEKTALALVVLVPGPSWIKPVKTLFVARFGGQWYALEPDTPKTPQKKAERNTDVADYLTRGYPSVPERR
jgi:hypothetical protein